MKQKRKVPLTCVQGDVIKRILLIVCMAVCFFSLSACSSTDGESGDVDPAMAGALQQQAVGLLENIVSIPADQMDVIIDQNREGGAEALAAGLENFRNTAHELGSYVSSGEGNVSSIDGGYKITVDTVFEKRPVSFEITLDKDMVNITSMSFNPVYTTAEKMEKAALNTLMGMGTVFCVLIFISFLISGFRHINAWEEKQRSKMSGPAEPAPAAPPVMETEENLADDLELVAVITAAIAASENTSADGLVVRSIRRASAGKWKRA